MVLKRRGVERVRPEETIQAAGGVVRRMRDGRTEILVVHRPRYDDWSLPKGKLRPGEEHAEAARREVAEETGVECQLEGELGATRYRDGKGRPKRVRYWLMAPARDPEPGIAAAVPNAEVDEVRWVTPAAARHLLSYPHDRALVEQVAASH